MDFGLSWAYVILIRPASEVVVALLGLGPYPRGLKMYWSEASGRDGAVARGRDVILIVRGDSSRENIWRRML